ncbi:MAG: hypothetical protein AB7V08_14695 [Elusimicrobiales bacterium]
MAEDRDLDLFDLDLEDDEDLTGEEEAIPKSKVSEIVKKRLARERKKHESLAEEFRRVYGMSPEEVLEFGRRELMTRAVQAPAAAQAQQEVPQEPVEQEPGVAEAGDSTLESRLAALEARQRALEEQERMRAEALEFVQKFPGVKVEDIPPEVFARRAKGGVTLAEAYKLYIADKQAEEAARKAAEATALNIKARERARVEGADYTGGADERPDASSLTPEERDFINRYFNGDWKAYLKYKQRLSAMEEA